LSPEKQFMSALEDFKKTFTQNGDGLTRIIIVNVIIFLVVNIIDQLIKFTGIGPSLSYWLALPGDVMLALQHAWTFITYMFLHQGLMHILFNMLWLYWMGKIFI
jgi:membrane associated rhomboid family serine protease